MSTEEGSNPGAGGCLTDSLDGSAPRDERSPLPASETSSTPATLHSDGQSPYPGSTPGTPTTPLGSERHQVAPNASLISSYYQQVSSNHSALAYSFLTGIAGQALGRPLVQVVPGVGDLLGVANASLGNAGHQGPQPISPPPPAPQISAAELSLLTEASATNNGTFQCTLCSKQFGYKNGLIRHVRLTHVGEKPYQCTICNRRFGYKHILMEHQNLHFGNRPYACPQCDKRFAARSNLIQHRMVHKRPFNCTLCTKRFDREDQLKKHLFAHPQALLMCGACRFTATSQPELNQHIQDEHAGSYGMHSPRYDGGGEEEGKRKSESEEERMETGMEERSISGSLRVGGVDGRGHRIDAICSQLSTSAAGSYFQQSQSPYQNIIVKKELIEAGDPDRQEKDIAPENEQHSPRAKHSEKHLFDANSLATSVAAYNQFMEQFPWPPRFPAGSSAGANLFPSNLNRSSGAISPAAYAAVDFLAAAAAMGKQLQVPDATLGASGDEKIPSSTLPGIHEMFSRRNQKLPSFANFIPGVQTKALTASSLPELVFQSTPPSSMISSLSTSSSSSAQTVSSLVSTQPFGAILSSVGMNSFTQRPTAQLPPITHAMRQSKDRTPQTFGTPSQVITSSTNGQEEANTDAAGSQQGGVSGFPSLDDVLAYYISQGRLFKCTHCSILFFERGMYFLHASLHGLSSPWECSICHKVCADKNEFTLHFVNQQHTS